MIVASSPFARALTTLAIVSGCGTPAGYTSNSVSDASFAPDGLAIVDADVTDATLSSDGMANVPVTLASAQFTPNCLTVDTTNVYWTTGDGKVMSVPIAGGEPTVLASDQTPPLGLAVDATSIYWVTSSANSGAVMSVSKAGGSPRTLADSQRGPVRIAVADAFLYWTNRTSGAVMRMPTSGGTPTPLAERQGTLTAIAAQARDVYWSAIGQTAIRRRLEGRDIETIASGTHAAALSVIGATVYWADVRLREDGAGVFKLDERRGSPIELARSPSPVAAVADQHQVYWSDDATGTIRRVPVEGGEVVVVASGQASPTDLVIDDENIYWINAAETGSIMKLAK